MPYVRLVIGETTEGGQGILLAMWPVLTRPIVNQFGAELARNSVEVVHL